MVTKDGSLSALLAVMGHPDDAALRSGSILARNAH
jgi:hypothetical protein